MASDLKLESFSDREILHIINDLGGSQHYVEVDHIITRIGLRADGMSEEQLFLHAKRCVSVRLAWIKKLSGTVERNPDAAGEWRLTDAGKRVVGIRITRAVEQGLDEMDDFATLAALGALGRRYQRADTSAANLMRREFVYGIHPKRRA